ncbi:MAG TPA: glycoside hydrolase family 31 protein [Clostridiales bacterium]|nr:glycoside hydrolase family 31 protein [Clostridiales bacterium]
MEKQRVASVFPRPNALDFTLASENGTNGRFRLLCSGEKAFRLLSVPLKNGKPATIAPGAAQILATDLGETPDNTALPLCFLTGDNCIEISGGNGKVVLSLKPFSLTFQKEDGKTAALLDTLMETPEGIRIEGVLTPKERLYGTGERFNRVNQRGKLVDIMSIDKWCKTEGNSYAPVPLVLSTEGYGLFYNKFERSLLDLGHTEPDRWKITAAVGVDLYVFVNSHPKDTLNAYSKLTGFSPMPFSWQLGIFVSRHGRTKELATLAGVEAMIEDMERHRLPWDAVVIEGWPVYDPASHDDLKTLVKKLHAMDKRVLVWEGCGRYYAREEEKDPFGYRKEYSVSHAETGEVLLPETDSYNPADSPNPRKVAFLDITNPKARAWWYDGLWTMLTQEIGIDGAKIDFCEQFPEHIPLNFYDGRSESGAHHWYPVVYNTLAYRTFTKNGKDGGCFSRGGGIGTQRYPFMWLGDQRREWRFLPAILTGLLSCSLSGIPFVTHDLSAYRPAEDESANPESKVFIRGAQMGAFTLNMQTHGTVTRPYDFAPEIVDIYRVYCEIHQALRPYLLEQCAIASQTGNPVLRNLYFHDPADEALFDIEDQFMLGEGILVAPVLQDTEKRDVYLPKGTWRCLFSGKTYAGGQRLENFAAPFARIPVFVLEGTESKTLPGVIAEVEKIIQASGM